MAKNRNKKKNGSTAMAVDSTAADHSPTDEPQAMDTSETTLAKRVSFGGGALSRKVNKGRAMKRSKNARKMKAVAKAVSKSEISLEKTSKTESKILRTKSAKNLYQ